MHPPIFASTQGSIDPILERYQRILHHLQSHMPAPQLLAVSKFQPTENMQPLLDNGHRLFAESRYEEAIAKWTPLKERYHDISLHYIGALQSRKIKKIVSFFDVIQSVDSRQTVEKVAESAANCGKKMSIFIQVNIGNEPQKQGVRCAELTEICNLARNSPFLTLEGLMCIPPHGLDATPFFAQMAQYKQQLALTHLSMGMSEDYLQALAYHPSYVRIGSLLFGKRNP